MKIAIKNPAPIGRDLQKWGDYHFGLALATALEKLGATVVHHYWPEWDRDDGEDLVIVLRGKRSYVPDPAKLSLIWIISHPGTVKFSEIELYDMVYTASETHYKSIVNISGISVDVARQCTDTSIFFSTDQDHLRRDVSFVANSRGIRREMLSWAVNTQTPVHLVGRHWHALQLDHLVKSQYIDNKELPNFYRKTRLTLNDHWNDMTHFGYINNRIFDCLACGTPILTDEFPELRAVCGDGLLYASDMDSFSKAIQEYVLGYPDILGRTKELWKRIGSDYTFDARAAQIWDWANSIVSIRQSLCHTAQGQNRTLAHMAAVIDEGVTYLRKAGVIRDLTTLHLCPSPQGTSSLFALKDVAYLSGGFGAGPWHVLMDQGMTMVADRHFDLIVLESSSNFVAISEKDQLSFIDRLSSKLSPDGILVVPLSMRDTFNQWMLMNQSGTVADGYAMLSPLPQTAAIAVG